MANKKKKKNNKNRNNMNNKKNINNKSGNKRTNLNKPNNKQVNNNIVDNTKINNSEIKKKNDIELKIKISEKDMFHFMLGHVYSRFSNKITLLFSIVCLIFFPISFLWHDIFTTIILLFGALLYLVVSPLMLFLQSKKQFLTNPVYKEAIIYKINDNGFSILQTGQWVDFEWDNLYKVIQRKYNLLFYINKNQAFILPLRLIKEKHMKYIKKHVDIKMESLKIKFSSRKMKGSFK